MNCKEYNEKYTTPDREQDFWAAIKQWLQDNPDYFIFFRTYVPGFNDGEPCLPTIEMAGKAPGFIDDYYVTSTGEVFSHYELYHDKFEFNRLPKRDQKYLRETEGQDYTTLAKDLDFELEALLHDGYEDFVQEWNVTGTIKLVNDRRRKNHGEPVVEVDHYDCGY